ncbi:YveK family protein [Alkalihalobacterium chitinilyticum]|uniref:Wzz/FepE/Etk N-terminal domain-containing protein n=1 Tax=Alkalihalobacterium chitinilyticum TaxID=2980103 RepID=A0ABT5VK66_9BACI|nr:Wzz/FepE/Etk N-terminal domain-containing protein [Alkalihalobacterium chitinilyticum]MDE5415834.1 Wzz/FepE/Etk N-terminal domain-containing protein [Alkalihalobacterium chitinilyticum]
MEETISLKELFTTLRKRIKLLIILPLIAVVVSGLVSYLFLTPIYQSSTQILVNQSKPDMQNLSQADLRTNLELINTYNVIMKSPVILEKVIDELNLNISVRALNNSVTVGSAQNSQVVEITVQHEDPAMAAQIANTIATVFQREIVNIMNVDNVSILSVAQISDNPSPVKPNPTLNMAVAFVVGLMAAVGLAFLLEYLDTTVKTEQDIESLLGLPVIGVVSQMEMTGTVKKNRRKAS